MSQISPPIRIVLVVAVAFLAAWFTVLKPKAPADDFDDSPPAAASTPNTSAKRAVDAARAGAATAQADADRAGATSAEAPAASAAATSAVSSTTASAPATAASGDAALAKLPAPVRGAFDAKKVLVLLFQDGRSADDRAVRRAVAAQRGRGVLVHIADVHDIARYAAVTRGANVTQTPTVLVVDRNRKVDTLVGFVDAESVRQLVVDARRAR